MAAWPLKRWAVRQLSGWLSDYLEGITEQNLEASLSLEVGQVDIKHVRVQPDLLAEEGLRLLSSDVGGVSARIPWRSLGSEPTVITVRDVWIEAETLSPTPRTQAELMAAVERWRNRRLRRVQTRVEALRAAALSAAQANQREATTKRSSVSARLGHAALRQLQVRVERLHIRLHSIDASSPVLDLFCERAALDEGSASRPGTRNDQVPPEMAKRPPSLDKVLELVGLSARLLDPQRPETVAKREGLRELLGKRQRELERARIDKLEKRKTDLEATKAALQRCGTTVQLSVVGPLALDARLWHSAADGLLWLSLELYVTTGSSVATVSPMVARYLCDTWEWYRSTARRPSLPQLPAIVEVAGTDGFGALEEEAPTAALSAAEYMEQHARRLRGEPFDARALLATEDLATEDWIVKLQAKCNEQVAAESPAAIAAASALSSTGDGTVARLPASTLGAQKAFAGETRGGASSRVLGWWRRLRPGADAVQRQRSGRGSAQDDDAESAPIGDAASASSGGGLSDLEEARSPVGSSCGVSAYNPPVDGDGHHVAPDVIAELVAEEDVEEPRRLELRCVIRRCTILALTIGGASSSRVRIDGGLECRAAIAALSGGGGAIAGLLEATSWDLDVQSNLSSVAVLLDETPLVLLQQDDPSDGGWQFADCIEDEEELQLEQDARSEGHAARLAVACNRRGGGSSASGSGGTWALRVRLKQEPLRFLLAPQSLRTALDVVLVVGGTFKAAWRQMALDSEVHAVAAAEVALEATCGAEEVSLPAGGVDLALGGAVSETMVTLDLDLDVAAPTLRWALLPEGHVTVALGRLLFRTCGSPTTSAEVAPHPVVPALELAPPQTCTWRAFACCCHLRETSVAVKAIGGEEQWVYDPSTICLRAWRDVADSSLGSPNGCWQLRIDSEVVRWTADPGMLEAAAQLPLSLDFALGRLREASVMKDDPLCASAAAATNPTATVVSSIAAGGAFAADGSDIAISEDRAAPRVCVQVKLGRFEVLGCGLAKARGRLALVSGGIECEYAAYNDRVDCQGQVASFDFAYEGTSLLSILEGAFLRVLNADRHLSIAGGSGLIAVQWDELRMREVMAGMTEAHHRIAEGQRGAQALLVVGEESVGASAQLWSQYVSQPLQATVQRHAATRLAELLPGSGDDTCQAASSGSDVSSPADITTSVAVVAEIAEPSQATAAAAAVGATAALEPVEAEDLPRPRGECSVEVHLTYEGLAFTFVQASESCDAEAPPAMQVVVTGASCGFRGHRSGDGVAEVSLKAVDLAFEGRRLLTPRRADRLLHIVAVRCAPASSRGQDAIEGFAEAATAQVKGQPSVHWTASWAQVCVLFRQKDYDRISSFVRTSVLGVLPVRTASDVEPPSRARGNEQALPPQQPTERLCADAAASVVPPPALRPRFRLEIGAPLVFLPTDRATVLTTFRSQPEDALLARNDLSSGSDLASWGEPEDHGGELKVGQGGEPSFTPRLGEGFLVFDFGHVAAQGGGRAPAGETQLQLRGAHVLGACPSFYNQENGSGSNDGSLAAQELLCPVSLDAAVRVSDTGPFEFSAVSRMDQDVSRLPSFSGDMSSSPSASLHGTLSSPTSQNSLVDHRMSFTRAQLTLILDVLAENVCYSSRSGYLPQAEALTRPDKHLRNVSSGQSIASSNASSLVSLVEGSDGALAARRPGTQKEKDGVGRGLRFSWSWPGNLVWDVGFTESHPLLQFRLQMGCFYIETSPARSVYGLRCERLSATDTRRSSRNAEKALLEYTEPIGSEEGSDSPAQPGFKVEFKCPADAETTILFHVSRPVMYILPQLVMDVITAGTSAWQHCTFRNDRAQPPPKETMMTTAFVAGRTRIDEKPPPGTRIEISFLNGTFRIAEKWSEPMEHFEFAGSLLISLLNHNEGIRIERFDLEHGALRLRSRRRGTETTLCPCLEWVIRGEQRRTDDDTRMKRHTRLDFRSVVVPPYSIRMSAQDHRALMGAFAELAGLDSESSEPASELTIRDPLAEKLVDNRYTITAIVVVQGAEVQILVEEGGHAWPGLKAHTRWQHLEITTELRPATAPTVNVFTKELEIELWAHNHRLGAWESVIPSCFWRLSYHMQRKPDGHPGEVDVRFDVAAVTPVRLIVAAPTIHIIQRVLQSASSEMRYGDLLSGINISGVACVLTAEGVEECILREDAQEQPLDLLLKGSSRTGPTSEPCLELAVAGASCPGAPCCVPMAREVCVLWNTEVAGLLVCRVIMPRPPQRVLLITSTVCVRNLTETDLQVRFLHPGNSKNDVPVLGKAAIRVVEASRLGIGHIVGSGRSLEHVGHLAAKAESSGADGALRLCAGHLLSAPPDAQLRKGQVILQLRPVVGDGVDYEWSDCYLSMPDQGTIDEGTTVCSKPPATLRDIMPRHWLHVQSSNAGEIEGCCLVDVQAPYTVVNACPCPVFCRLNPPSRRCRLGTEMSRLPSGLVGAALMPEVFVSDGFGRELKVPPDGSVEVYPFKLDGNKSFYWRCGDRRERFTPKWDTLNCLLVVLRTKIATLEWHCLDVMLDTTSRSQGTPVKVRAQATLPVFDCKADALSMTFALKDVYGQQTSWSLPVWAMTSTRNVDEFFELKHHSMRVRLNAYRQKRQIVVYTKWWFVNSTGLDVQLYCVGGPGPMHAVPCFGDGDGQSIMALPEARNESGDGVAHMMLRGFPVVVARVPDAGGSEPVDLSPFHPCCLRTEMVACRHAQASTHVSCCLVSLLPSLLLFNKTSLEIGFRLLRNLANSDSSSINNAGSVGTEDRPEWIGPGCSDTLWGVPRSSRAISVAARSVGTSVGLAGASGHSMWSEAIGVRETWVGAYPLTLKPSTGHGSLNRRLVCVCVDQDADVFSVTVRDSNSCHTLINRNPRVELEARLEGTNEDINYLFTAHYGETVPIGGKGKGSRMRLLVRSNTDPSQKAMIGIHLNRTGLWTVPLALVVSNAAAGQHSATSSSVTSRGRFRAPQASPLPNSSVASSSKKSAGARSTLTVPTLVAVELRNRVAVVSVMPNTTKSSSSGSTANSTVIEPTIGNSEMMGLEDGEQSGRKYTFLCELRLDLLTVAIITEGRVPSAINSSSSSASLVSTAASASVISANQQRFEAFTVSLAHVSMEMAQHPDHRRDVSFSIKDAQVDSQRPTPVVLLRSTTQPFLQYHSERVDVRMLDVHLRLLRMEIGESELAFNDSAWEQLRHMRRHFGSGAIDMSFDDVLARARVPYHLSDLEPPSASSKVVLSRLEVDTAKVTVWCEIYLPDAHYVPKTLRDAIQVVSLGTNHLQVKGANVQVPKQVLFSETSPAEGNIGSIFAKVSEAYLPHIKACWRSLLQHSNIFLGGLLSRSTWMPRQRQACAPQPSVCAVDSHGQLLLRYDESGGLCEGRAAQASRSGFLPSGPRIASAKRLQNFAMGAIAKGSQSFRRDRHK